MMKTNFSFSLVSGLIAGSAAIAIAQAPAQAASFSANNLSDRNQCPAGSLTCTINNFFQLSTEPTGRQITQKKEGQGQNAIWGFGVASNGTQPTPSDPSWGEIDTIETLDVAFVQNGKQKKGILESLQLSFLYPPQNAFGDRVFEMALVNPDGETVNQGTLQAISNTQANWIFNGVTTLLSAVSPSTSQGGGSYVIHNPFGNLAMSGFSLKAQSLCTTKTNCRNLGQDSDFALTAAKVREVPEPATLLGLGAVGLLAIAQRRRSVKAN